MNSPLPLPPSGTPPTRRQSLKHLIFSLSVILIAIAIISCMTVDRVVAATPKITEATFVGSTACESCHEAPYKAMKHLKHAADCESCHGPASVHLEKLDKESILNPSKMPGDAASAKCLSCHSKDKQRSFWKGSPHSKNEAGCVSCHQVHGTKKYLLKRNSESETCFECHSQVRADILKRSKHPLRDSSTPEEEGKMRCSSCHNPHGAKGDKLVDARSINDKCYECHMEKKAPVLWEHSPVKEDCLTCHAAHGSINDKMLVTKVPRLCQQCHMQGRHQTGTLAQNSVFLLNRGCLNCHPMVHGSNNPSGAVLQR